MDHATDEATGNRAYSEIVRGAFSEAEVQAMAERARQRLGGKASIAFVFTSCDLRHDLTDIVELIQIHSHCPHIVGASASGIIGVGCEEEDVTGFSILALYLPNTQVAVYELPKTGGESWETARQWNQRNDTSWILLGNPIMTGEQWMSEWNSVMGNAPTYGGLASGSHRAEELFIFTEKGFSDAAAIAIGFQGGIKLHGLVSQGCRPIGEPLTITKADDHLIYQLASVNAYDQLQAAFNSLPEDEREKAQGNILVGLAMTEYVEDFSTGDFLVRSIIGGDPANGSLAVGASPRVGQTLQFQLRDRTAADDELREMLSQAQADLKASPFAGLLFTCGGRGQRLFGIPHHDAALFKDTFGFMPTAGFFCNGEIGTVGEKAYLHGFTASGVLLVDA